MSTAAPPQPVVLRLAIVARPGQRQALLDFLREAAPYYEAPGGIRMRLLQDANHPDKFIEEFEYATSEAFQADNLRVETDPVMKSYLDRWRALLLDKAEVTVFHDVTSQIR
ncbi:MAG: antibiotic biosynthesis monooxygenase [Polyangiaceae bacterium]|nr:antibiotic biosynthesis monooxygenase [Polyangiaceae bacterium]